MILPVNMRIMALCYQSGEEVLPGDRINFGKMPGYVVFVVGREGVPSDWIFLEGKDQPRIMLDVEGIGYVLDDQDDEDLTFVSRRIKTE